MTLCYADAPAVTPSQGPFDLQDEPSYRRWREAKLDAYPLRIANATVEVRDPRALTHAEHDALLQRCRRCNFAVYASCACDADKDIPRLLGRQFGLTQLDCNWLADEDGVSSLAVCAAGHRSSYIPYTDRAIRWHTDGYYNAAERRIRAMVLHCVSDAESGGESALLDHEVACILLRDADPGLVRALLAPDALTIPARVDDAGVARGEQTGPVFHIDAVTGDLHMRYTARTHSIAWKQEAATLAAVALLQEIVVDSRYVVRVRLAPGMGIIANNVLHKRAAFRDGATHRRLLYRARYYDRIAGTHAAYANMVAAPLQRSRAGGRS